MSSAFVAIPILAFPSLKSLLSVPGDGRTSRLMLVLALITGAFLAFDLWSNLQAQLAGAGGEHARQGHWGTAFSLDLVLTLAALLAAGRRPGWRTLSLLVCITLVYLGAAALALPDHAGSWGSFGGLALFGGIGLIVATWKEGWRSSLLTASYR